MAKATSHPSIPGPRESRRTVDLGPFTKIPNKLFGSGKAAALGPSATLLYVALCEQANRAANTVFSISDRSLAADTGLAARTICDARKRLQEQKMLSVTRQNGRSYSYSLFKCDLLWIQRTERQRPTRKPRAKYAT